MWALVRWEGVWLVCSLSYCHNNSVVTCIHVPNNYSKWYIDVMYPININCLSISLFYMSFIIHKFITIVYCYNVNLFIVPFWSDSDKKLRVNFCFLLWLQIPGIESVTTKQWTGLLVHLSIHLSIYPFITTISWWLSIIRFTVWSRSLYHFL